MNPIDQFPAAELVYIPMSQMPPGAAAYTDGSRIFLPIGASKSDERTIIRHESAHIWLRHFRRKEDRKHQIWACACELEIARNIYDDIDLNTMNDRSSLLNKAYRPDSMKDLPIDLKLAEEIYEWLLKKQEEEQEKFEVKCSCKTCDSSDKPSDKPSDSEEIEVTQEMIEAIKEQLDSSEKQEKLQKSVAKAVALKAPPTLASEMDALFRRAFSRERSYLRPSRREIDSDLIERGRINKIRSPRVQIYVDRSGSFTSAKTACAMDKLSKLLVRYKARIKSDTFYFGNSKIAQFDFGGGGNTPYDLVVEHINDTSPEVAIVITDDDSASGCGRIEVISKILVMPIDCSETSIGKEIGGIHLQ